MALELLQIGLLIAATATILYFLRRTKRDIEHRLKRIELRIKEQDATIRLQEAAFGLPLPWTQWALSAGCLLRIRESFAKRQIRTVVECGAGMSTLYLARFVQATGGRVVTLEDNAVWASTVQGMLDAEGLADRVTLLTTPLAAREIGGRTVHWYDVESPDALGIDTVELLVVDGPVGSSGAFARYAALPFFAETFEPGTEIYLDDAGRDEERQIVEEWGKLVALETEMIRGARPYARMVVAGP